MPDLSFLVEGIEPRRPAGAPELAFRLTVAETTGTPVLSVALRCQVRIQPARRRYTGPEKDKLLDLFGTPDRWGQTVREMPWANAAVEVPPFVGETTVALPVPCDQDRAPAARKYLDALDGGEVPLIFLFNGTMFYEAAGVGPQVGMIPWDKEARYRLGVTTWKTLSAEPATP